MTSVIQQTIITMASSRLSGIILLVICQTTVSGFGYGDSSKSSLVSLEQSPGNNEERFPNDYTIWFSHNGEIVYYDLVRDDRKMNVISPDVAQHVPFIPGGLMTDENEHEFAYYENGKDEESRESAFFILHRPDPQMPARVYGQIDKDGNRYTVTASANGNDHTVRHDYALSNERYRAKRHIATHQIIEVTMWYGPDFYAYHSVRLGGDAALLATFLTDYPKSILRDVNVMFSTVETAPITVYFNHSDGDTDTAVFWYADHLSGGYLPITSVVNDLASYLDGESITPTDHTIVLTRADLANDVLGDGKFKIAYGNGQLCTASPRSVGIAETFGPDTTRAIAQAVAFGFPSTLLHWKLEEYTILDHLKWVFPIPTALNLAIWSFDSTAENRFEDDINGWTNNCLEEQNLGTDLYEFLTSNSFGETYTMDEQCDILYGTSTHTSTVCGGFTGSTLCYKEVLCQTESAGCTGNIVPGDKTLCSDDKYQFEYGCRLSECTFQLTNTTTTSTTSTSSTSTTSTTSSTTSTTASTTTSTTFSTSTTSAPTTTTTTEEGLQTTTTGSDSTMTPTSGAPYDCCCERRPLGKVEIEFEYIPCPELDL